MADLVSVATVAVVVGCGDSLGGVDTVALACGEGASEETGVSLGDANGDGEMVGVGEVFLFFRCFGAAVGRTKSFFNLSPNDSSCSWVPRARAVLIAIVIPITNTKRSFLFTPTSGSAGQFLEHSLVHSNAGFKILQRKIFIRRMRPAILQRETDQ
jgi:hypothetical protein